jgi:cell division protein FtsB
MAKASQLEKALASLRAERDVLDLAIRKLEAQQTAKVEKPARRKSKVTPSEVQP